MKKWITVLGLLLFMAACNEQEPVGDELHPDGLGIFTECSVWDKFTLYNGGSTVTYEGQGYEAKRWTIGDVPSPQGRQNIWKLSDVCDDVAPVPRPEPQEGDMVVTLLGTGTPIPDPTRFGPATLVQAGGLNLLFDAGRGVPVRLNQVGVRSGDIDGVFLTHFHSDHVSGLPDVWMTGYLNAPFGGRQESLNLIGPVGADNLATNLREAYAEDIDLRIEGNGVPPVATEINVSEFENDGVVFEQAGVTVTAFDVDHGDVNEPAFGYRVDFGEHSVLISGDTTTSPNLIANAEDLDLLVHEVAALPDALLEIPVFAGIQSIHVTPEEGGDIFAETQPKHAAYSHIILLGTPDVLPLTTKDIETRTRTTYEGPLTIGEDLTRFIIGDDVVAQPWSSERGYK